MKPDRKTARPVKPILFVLVMLLMGGIYLNLAWKWKSGLYGAMDP